jgi:hypothetical protein
VGVGGVGRGVKYFSTVQAQESLKKHSFKSMVTSLLCLTNGSSENFGLSKYDVGSLEFSKNIQI